MKKIISLKTTIFMLAAIIIVSGWLHRQSFNSYFFQDDWYSFRISEVNQLKDILSFFIPNNEVIYFRPFGMQVPFFLMNSIFGLNPLPYRLLTFFIHGLNIILVYLLINKLFKNPAVSLLVAYFYGTSTVLYIPFYWFATFAFTLVVTFFFSSFLLLWKFIEDKKRKYYLFSLVAFVAGLLTNELIAVLPLLAGVYFFINHKAKEIKYLFPFAGLIMLFLTLRFVLYPPPLSGDYTVTLGKNILTNLYGYLLCSFNWPEEMKAQLINFYTVNGQFIKDFGYYYAVFIVTLLLNIVFIASAIISVIITKTGLSVRHLVFAALWFFLGLLPVLGFQSHFFAYYVPISLVGLLYIYSRLIISLIKIIYDRSAFLAIIILLIIMTNWYFTGLTTTGFNQKIHFAPRRSEIARKLVTEALSYYPLTQKEKIIYVRSDPENILSLNNQDAMKVVYKDNSIETNYDDFAPGKKIL